jgi:hypothetical protein
MHQKRNLSLRSYFLFHMTRLEPHDHKKVEIILRAFNSRLAFWRPSGLALDLIRATEYSITNEQTRSS